jgi:hypothetical protein
MGTTDIGRQNAAGSVAAPGHRQRLTVELLDDETALVRSVRALATLRGITLRQWVMEAVREKYEREREHAPGLV